PCVPRAQNRGLSEGQELSGVVGGMGQPRRPADRASAAQVAERVDASDPDPHRLRTFSRRADQSVVGNRPAARRRADWRAADKVVRVPVGCAKAARRIIGALVRYRPRAVIGLGEAGGRPAISLERIAINLADERGALAKSGDPGFAPIVDGGPDAYFSRLPLRAIIRELDRKQIP